MYQHKKEQENSVNTKKNKCYNEQRSNYIYHYTLDICHLTNSLGSILIDFNNFLLHVHCDGIFHTYNKVILANMFNIFTLNTILFYVSSFDTSLQFKLKTFASKIFFF